MLTPVLLICDVEFSHDGSLLAASHQEGWITLWSIENEARRLMQFKAHPEAPRSLLFSSDDRRLITCDDEGSIKIWSIVPGRSPDEAPTPYELLEIGHYPEDHDVRLLRFTHDGQTLISAGGLPGKSGRIEAWAATRKAPGSE